MKGFSLVELLCVIAMIAIITALAVPAVQSVNTAQAITQGAAILHDQLLQAKQYAQGHNRNVEVRIVNFGTSDEPVWQGVQLWMENEDGTALTPIGKLEMLPAHSQIAPKDSLSPLLTAAPARAGQLRYGARQLPYVAFQVRASGSLESEITKENNFLTIHFKRDTAVPPKNYATIRIHPLTARITEYRP